MKSFRFVALVLCVPAVAFAAPAVPGFTVDVYASVNGPNCLSFDAVGNLYSGNGCPGLVPDIGSIYRIDAVTHAVSSYGPALYDPDAVAVDIGGVFGSAGRVLVSGDSTSSGSGPGYLAGINADGTADTLVTTDDWVNAQCMRFDSSGRLILADWAHQDDPRVFSVGASGHTLLISPPARAISMAIGANDSIYLAETDGTILVYDSAGAAINGPSAPLAAGLDPMGGYFLPIDCGRGGVWGSNTYVISGGNLVSIDASGAQQTLGSGFGTCTDLLFGPDNAMYVADSTANEIYRIVPEPTVLSLVGFGSLWLIRRRGK